MLKFLPNRKVVYAILIVLLLTDLCYSFFQHKSQSLDGDLPSHVVPDQHVDMVLDHPFGLYAIFNNKTYHNPNRYFHHLFLKEYMTNAPIILQHFVTPIESIYLASAILKIIVQILLLLLISAIITGTFNMKRIDFLIACLLITPFFQTNGYRSYMGIIDPSVTYTFAYAFPLALLIVFMIPLIYHEWYGVKIKLSAPFVITWFFLAAVVSLNGPLNPAVLIIIITLSGIGKAVTEYSNRKKSKHKIVLSDLLQNISGIYWYILIVSGIFACYSLYLGTYNSSTINSQLPLPELYKKLPLGIYYQFTQKLGFPILLVALALNTFLITRRFKNNGGEKILKIFKWFGLFTLLYIAFLPLGGNREYRSHILRYDTIMPITLGLVSMYGMMSLHILKNMTIKQRSWYAPILILIIFVYTNSDEPNFKHNECEKDALQFISESRDSIIELEHNCTVLEWDKIINPEDSEYQARLLKLWNITDNKTYYYHK